MVENFDMDRESGEHDLSVREEEGH